MKLINMVEEGHYTYFQAGKKLGLSPSTAKMIVLKYKN
jgi:DNA-binding CsgD family transcriptional regulator